MYLQLGRKAACVKGILSQWVQYTSLGVDDQALLKKPCKIPKLEAPILDDILLYMCILMALFSYKALFCTNSCVCHQYMSKVLEDNSVGVTVGILKKYAFQFVQNDLERQMPQIIQESYNTIHLPAWEWYSYTIGPHCRPSMESPFVLTSFIIASCKTF